MKNGPQIVSTILIGMGMWFLGRYAHGCIQEKRTVGAKKVAKEAVHSWEGEGGAIVERAPRASAR